MNEIEKWIKENTLTIHLNEEKDFPYIDPEDLIQKLNDIRRHLQDTDHDCGTCQYKELNFLQDPCKSCREELFGYIYHNWQKREGEEKK
jgi:hypothetical protein